MISEIAILGSGKYIPQKVVMSSDIDKSIGKKEGYTEGKTGVYKRHFIKDETASYMGAKALLEAVSKANLDISQVDCIVCASGTIEQPIPCTAVLIQEHLSLSYLKTPCFDINSTCLSFVVAFDLMSYLISAGRYNNVAIVSTEISSVGLNWEDEESSMLFGDGATAVIIGKSNHYKESKIISSSIITISEGAHFSEIYGGGTKLSPHEYNAKNKL
jgi:3-oxoacyl-[acyl-carrier-protein] synthase-3